MYIVTHCVIHVGHLSLSSLEPCESRGWAVPQYNLALTNILSPQGSSRLVTLPLAESTILFQPTANRLILRKLHNLAVGFYFKFRTQTSKAFWILPGKKITLSLSSHTPPPPSLS
jgi:hypothetical protein